MRWVTLFLTLSACSGSRPAVSAADAYEADQLACVAQGMAGPGSLDEVRARIDACREGVRRRYGVSGASAADGGPDGR